MKGCQVLRRRPTCISPGPPRSLSPSLPARDGGCSPGGTWSSPAEGSGWRREGAVSCLGNWQWEAGEGEEKGSSPDPKRPPPPTHLGVLDKEASVVAVGALGALPAASTADAAHAALAAHAVPVTCCGGRSQAVRTLVGPAHSWLAAGQSQMLTLGPSITLPAPREDIPGLSGLRPTRGSWP